ncbi:hypothetical protein FHL15_002625 [Xylaria flabelliformis]|uniref:Uncharacterized protein n=1 Tax=Xylaria flabelliformis TaxID=2512241 RepID=A0A553I836_9PEZI|nr:hypothetical protein FHL15_002625 [Xylaria flabelliformis]
MDLVPGSGFGGIATHLARFPSPKARGGVQDARSRRACYLAKALFECIHNLKYRAIYDERGIEVSPDPVTWNTGLQPPWPYERLAYRQ